MKNITVCMLLVLGFSLWLPQSGISQSCQHPITATADSISCDDNGTPLDTLDDNFFIYLSVAGDSGTWSLTTDTTLYPYDSAVVFGPFLISGGAQTLIVLNTSDSLCTDTVSVQPPPPCSTPPPVCATPISSSVDSIACNDNSTPLDSLDDTYTFFLTATGGSGGWSVQGDSLVFAYDTAIAFGPYPISAGVLTLILADTADAVCTDTVSITPPAPCSVPPTCQTPITTSFADVLCNDNGTPLDSLDDTFTFTILATGGANSWSLSGDTLAYPYDTAATVGPFPIAGGPLSLLAIDTDDSLCVDTVMVTPPPPCSVPLTACDVKEIGCMKYELLSVVADSAQRKTYTIQVTNNCTNKMIYTAFQLPNGLEAKAPDDNTTYTAPSGREYLVRNPNFSPFYSIRFKSIADSISGGQSDIFEYTLPAQADPDYIHVVTRVSPKVFYEAHLNTFKCKDSTSQLVTPVFPTTPGPKTGPDPADPNTPNAPGQDPLFGLYPNPTTGPFYVDLTYWQGRDVHLHLFSDKGELIKEMWVLASDMPILFDLPAGLDAGLYWVRMTPAGGTPQVQQLVIQW